MDRRISLPIPAVPVKSAVHDVRLRDAQDQNGAAVAATIDNIPNRPILPPVLFTRGASRGRLEWWSRIRSPRPASQAGLGRPGVTEPPHYEGAPIVRLRRHRRTAGNRRDQRDRTLAQRGSRKRAGVRHSGPPAKSPVMARREALRWVEADVSARAHRMDYPNCASWRVIPLIVEGKTREVHFAQPTRQGRRVRARDFQDMAV